MTQPQELRIGNYYQGASRGNIEIVTWQTLRDLSEGKLNLLPIPLTEEILLKFGFEKKSGSEFKNERFIYRFKQRDLIIEGFEYDYNGILCHPEFAHQLQNLYFALTGEELQLK